MADTSGTLVQQSIRSPLLQIQGLSKSFPGVQALHDVTLTLERGEVLALLGENGAGKSTLIKILGGVYVPDQGTLSIDGKPISFASPRAALDAGVGIIYQEFNLAPSLTAVENLFLGQEQTTWGFFSRRTERTRAREVFGRLGVDVPLDVPCHTLSVAQQQIIEIAKALIRNAKILVMDEPTTALTPSEVHRLLNVIAELRGQGFGIIYVSHRLDEVQQIADRATVLRDGRHVATLTRDQLTRQTIIEWMVGRRIENEFPKQPARLGPDRLIVTKLCRGNSVKEVSFQVRAGEVVGITGLVGAGRTETARLIFGADTRDSGKIELDGRELSIRHPRDAIRAGICLLTEDRKHQGLMLERSVQENFSLPNLPDFSNGGFVQSRRERKAWDEYRQTLQIKVPHRDTLATFLSGGNQQKVVLAKWLQTNASVVIFDEPTRGIDVGAKYEIYMLINRLAEAGKAIVMISSELPEVLGMSDRILVMHQGRIVGEVAEPCQATQEQIMHYAVG
ncbi:MAG: sugar ABC transporter ATP-binding protein [Planctomycetaceae bacterium]|nr:sugar ABC transporter ATP-binding protein [Planctomycetaceae bacterium]